MTDQVKQIDEPRSWIVPTYALIGSLWIVGSDSLFALFQAPAALHAVKGVVFVVVTSVILHYLVRSYASRLSEHERQRHRAERLQVLGERTACVSHELRNVLMAVKSLASVLQRSIGVSPQAARTSECLQSALRRGEVLLAEVLGFASERAVQRQSVSLERWLDDFAECARQAVGKDISIAVSVAPPHLLVDADPVQLHQLLTNLVMNASDAMGQRGTIAIDARAVAGSSGGIEISVRDHGVGMPAAVAGRVFEPLFTTKRNGTGLGLAIVARIVAAHGGTVRLESEVGVGTTFHVLLPASDARHAAA